MRYMNTTIAIFAGLSLITLGLTNYFGVTAIPAVLAGILVVCTGGISDCCGYSQS